MKFHLISSVAAVALAVLATQGCAVASDSNDAEAEQTASSEAELHTNAQRIAGAYHGDFANLPPSLQGLVLKRDGKFFADVDTGIRCIMAPCPSHVRVEGRFFATRSYLHLSSSNAQETGGITGWYRYELIQGTKLSLTRPWSSSWQQSLSKEASYCAAPVDCQAQDLAQPRCIGGWTCGAENTCAFNCGPVGNVIWPATASKLVAKNSGGGFTPPPAPGSTCGVGAATYTLDVTTRKLDWEVCSFQDWQTPMHLVTGSKTLTAAEYATVDAKMHEVTIAEHQICGADKPFMALEVSSPVGVKKYTDSFYSCMGNGPFVDNIDGVFSAFRQIAN